MPTESRPGHVALIAGLYEDVSAVTKGWKMNPVAFDSVFNASRHTWSWGSPDILPMFKEGASPPERVTTECYDEEMEDFTSDATELDSWVFDRVATLFADARSNSTLRDLLHQDRIVFFLHLLGLDTTGHSYRPYSAEYLRNIKVVDEGLERTHRLVDEFYSRDAKTAWVFTADHGMSDWGSHGDGHPDNTRTPLVAWGAGVRAPVAAVEGTPTGHEDGFSADWGLDAVRRVDVAQADVAALMAYLVGLRFPVNSVGELPLEYLDAAPAVRAEAAWTNAMQIAEMYRVKEGEFFFLGIMGYHPLTARVEHKKATMLRYKPFVPLSEGEQSLQMRFADIRSLIENGAHDAAITKSTELIQIALEGLRYLQTYHPPRCSKKQGALLTPCILYSYDWLFLRTLVTAGYLGWIAFALTTVIDQHVLHGALTPSRSTASTLFFTSALIALYSVLLVQRSAWTYYAYGFFPAVFWEGVFARRRSIAAGTRKLVVHVVGVRASVALVLEVVAVVAILEAMVWGYFRREVFTACFLLAAAWPVAYGGAFVSRNRVLCAGWAVCCVAMSSFTLLPVVKVESTALM